MKVNKMIPIDEDLHQEMKVYCVKNHIVMKKLIEEWIRTNLDKLKEGTEVPNK